MSVFAIWTVLVAVSPTRCESKYSEIDSLRTYPTSGAWELICCAVGFRVQANDASVFQSELRDPDMFQWMGSLAPGIVAQAVLAISIVAAVGLALGSLRFRGIRRGTARVLFVGIFFGQLGMHIDERILWCHHQHPKPGRGASSPSGLQRSAFE